MSTCNFSPLVKQDFKYIVGFVVLTVTVYYVLHLLVNMLFQSSNQSSDFFPTSKAEKIANMVYDTELTTHDSASQVLTSLSKNTTDPILRSKPRKAWLMS